MNDLNTCSGGKWEWSHWTFRTHPLTGMKCCRKHTCGLRINLIMRMDFITRCDATPAAVACCVAAMLDFPAVTRTVSTFLSESHSHTCGTENINPPAEHLHFSPQRWAASGPRSKPSATHFLPHISSFFMEAQRYPISIRLIGVLHKEKSKVSACGVSLFPFCVCAIAHFLCCAKRNI